MLELKNITKKYYGGTVVLNKISFHVDKGDFVYLIGPSGVGKTTILKLLIGEMKPTAGKIFFNGFEIQQFKSKNIAKLRRKIRMIFQDFKILKNRTILENVMLSLLILGRSEKEASNEAKKMLKLVGLESKSQLFPIQLSAGELQRVAIARALAGGGEVILADEPTGNLDPQTGEEIIELLERINQEGTTIIITTHNAHMVNIHKKRVIELKDGSIVRDEKEGNYDVSS